MANFKKQYDSFIAGIRAEVMKKSAHGYDVIDYEKCPEHLNGDDLDARSTTNKCPYCGEYAAMLVDVVEKRDLCPWDGPQKAWWEVYFCRHCGGIFHYSDDW